MPKNNGMQVVAVQVEELDAMFLSILAARKRTSVSALLQPTFIDMAMEVQETLSNEGMDLDIKTLKMELTAELEIWKAELEKDGHAIQMSGDLNIRALVSASKRKPRKT